MAKFPYILGTVVILMCSPAFLFAGSPPPPPRSTPEIDPGFASTALATLAGGVLILTDRLRKK